MSAERLLGRFSRSFFQSFSSRRRLWIMICWGQVLIFVYRLYSTNSLKVFWSRSDERPGLGSFLYDVLSETNFKNQFRTWRSIMTHLPYTLQIFLAVSVAFLFFLKSHITCGTWTLSSFVLGMWGHRFSYEAHYFTTEIRMADEGIH